MLGVGHLINHRCLLLSGKWGGSCSDHVLPLDPTISELVFNFSLQHNIYDITSVDIFILGVFMIWLKRKIKLINKYFSRLITFHKLLCEHPVVKLFSFLISSWNAIFANNQTKGLLGFSSFYDILSYLFLNTRKQTNSK